MCCAHGFCHIINNFVCHYKHEHITFILKIIKEGLYCLKPSVKRVSCSSWKSKDQIDTHVKIWGYICVCWIKSRFQTQDTHGSFHAHSSKHSKSGLQYKAKVMLLKTQSSWTDNVIYDRNKVGLSFKHPQE